MGRVMNARSNLFLSGVIALLCSVVYSGNARAEASGPSHVELRKVKDGWTLYREGQPFFIQGAGGDASRQVLKDCGGNSIRLWGADNIDDQLAEAQRLGLSVTVGIWFEHEGGVKHFDYGNPRQVAEQLDRVQQAVLKYRNNPAVLLWGLGNEMEGPNGDNPLIWKFIEDAAKLVHRLDPNHPTMTVLAEIGGKRVENFNRYCPDVDILGINTYAGGPSVAARYHKLGGVKPFVITEFGPSGTWEVGLTAWNAPIEATSTAKSDDYRATYEKTVLPERGKLCLGAYAFLWGHKQEATATWFGMFLPDGSRLEPVDLMQQYWTGEAPARRCPKIEPIAVDHNDVEVGATVHASLSVTPFDSDPLTVKWVLSRDTAIYQTMGQYQKPLKDFPEAIVAGDVHGAEVQMPSEAGGYWLYAYVYDGKGRAATAVLPLHVHKIRVASGHGMPLPMVVYSGAAISTAYAPSGWMGDANALALDDHCPDDPHAGQYSMKCSLKADKGFGGIVWQDPANDWGDLKGGHDLSGATKLTFWARGQEGGETVSFKMGILGKDKKFPDSDHAELPDVVLTADWKQYTIDLADKDLSCIKTGFVWVLASPGKPVTFYLDDIQYE
jgi:hypothetical protein